MKKRFVPVLLALLLLGGCTPEQAPPIQTVTGAPSATDPAPVTQVRFTDFLNRVNEERKRVIEENPSIDISAWTGDFPEEVNVFTEEEIKLLSAPYTPPVEDVTKEELLEDVETCFRLLKTTYGAYGYFGGDEVFLPIWDAIRAEVAALDEPRIKEFSEIFNRHLSPLLVDGHFMLGEFSMRDEHTQYMYYVPGVYLTDLTGLDMNYVKPTVDLNGAITYGFFAMSHDGKDLPAAVGEYTLRWQRAGAFKKTDYTIFEETEREGIPVLISRGMVARNPVLEPQLERFASCGGEYAGKTFLFDLRGNNGGSDSWVGDWFEGWTGQPVKPRRAWGHKYSQISCHIFPKYYPAEKMGTWRTVLSDGKWAPNSGMVFALTDKGVASSGESAVQYLRSAENVLFVGGPTLGCALVPNNGAFYLPHSKLSLYFGTGLSFAETIENRDGIGYLPDLWVNPPDAEDAVLRLIEHYNLK